MQFYQQPVAHAGLRIGLLQVGEGKQVDRVKQVQEWMAVARRLCEAVIEVASSGARNMRHHSVEHLSATLIPVESVVEERAEKSPALRTAVRIGALNVAGHVIERKTRIIPSATTL